ncbi:hypothetical protein [Methanocella arvoryzae]|uniref:Uncharacterized protein n=1 Tax=Methanocella arvoryzae (strain DSM 22066 / NBRC 105507 / MRE50) TaxID=351160 RepID=Q0W5X3_METAR|nr:hypothetical protein [Methanocella arvoryzae]CAJ36220.1 hypothetical protein RCIX857 [Methanocella arvoryzae MRE50]
MRIPDDIEDLVLAFVEPDKKKDLMRMSRAEIDELILAEISCAVEPGFIEKSPDSGGFPYRVTPRGREILQMLAPCKRSGR